ncbi:MAG: hypothetical protein FJ319_00020 [SAR202 cluster bacterium]|nr:hypothetical protein [SAR202 cluster bacterium]
MGMKDNVTRMRSDEAKQSDTTDWERIKRLTDEEIAAAVASDPDAAPIDHAFWESGFEVILPDPKRPVSLRLDADVVDWFRRGGRGYQTRINAVLRSYVSAQIEREKRAVAKKKTVRKSA